jgi:hypothetical protein
LRFCNSRAAIPCCRLAPSSARSTCRRARFAESSRAEATPIVIGEDERREVILRAAGG